jgi:hypothetical protein
VNQTTAGPDAPWIVNATNITTGDKAPSPRFLALHAASAKAFWLSGAADVFMKVEYNPEDAEAITACEALVTQPTKADLEKDLEKLENLKPVGGTTSGRTNTPPTGTSKLGQKTADVKV